MPSMASAVSRSAAHNVSHLSSAVPSAGQAAEALSATCRWNTSRFGVSLGTSSSLPFLASFATRNLLVLVVGTLLR